MRKWDSKRGVHRQAERHGRAVHLYVVERTYFVSAGEGCELTIKGFYNVCLCRFTRVILSFFHDRECNSLQQLKINAVPRHRGFTYEEYELNLSLIHI